MLRLNLRSNFIRPRAFFTAENFHSRPQKSNHDFHKEKNIKCYRIVKNLLLNVNKEKNLKEFQALGVTKSGALSRAPMGAALIEENEEFINIFNKWWAKIYDYLNELDSNKFLQLIRFLGKINHATQRKLRQNLTLTHLQALETQFLETENEPKWDSRCCKLLFEGYFRLSCYRDFYSTIRAPSNDVVSKCLNFFEMNSRSDENMPNWEYECDFVTSIAFLSELSIFPPYTHLMFIIQRFDQIFESTISNYSQEHTKNKKFELYVNDFTYLTNIYEKIGNIFLRYRLNPDQIKPGFWQRWFQGAKCLMELENIYSVKEIQQVQRKKPGCFINENLFLIVCCLNVATKFDKMDELLALKNLISEILTKSIPYCRSLPLYFVHTSLRDCEMAFKVKLFDEKFAKNTLSKRIIVLKNNAVISEMAEKVEEFIHYKNKFNKDKFVL